MMWKEKQVNVACFQTQKCAKVKRARYKKNCLSVLQANISTRQMKLIIFVALLNRKRWWMVFCLKKSLILQHHKSLFSFYDIKKCWIRLIIETFYLCWNKFKLYGSLKNFFINFWKTSSRFLIKNQPLFVQDQSSGL